MHEVVYNTPRCMLLFSTLFCSIKWEPFPNFFPAPKQLTHSQVALTSYKWPNHRPICLRPTEKMAWSRQSMIQCQWMEEVALTATPKTPTIRFTFIHRTFFICTVKIFLLQNGDFWEFMYIWHCARVYMYSNIASTLNLLFIDTFFFFCLIS